MVVNRVSKEEVAAAITPGVIYITKGTSQQVRELLPEHVVTEHHYNPTTTTFRRWLIPNLIEDRVIAKIIYYPILEGTGRVRERKSTGKAAYGSVKSSFAYALPNDQTMQLPNNMYFFVLLADPISGEVSKVNAKSNLEGDCIQELDLRHVIFNEGSDIDNELPITARIRSQTTHPVLLDNYKEDYLPLEDSDWFRETNPYIEQLLSDRGVSTWYGLGQRGEYYKYFLVDLESRKGAEDKVPLLLKAARAWCLSPYLSMFLEKVKDNNCTAPVQLAQFAAWVYIASRVLTNPRANGLYWYEPRAANKKGYWVFKPSREAKLQLPTFLQER